MFKGVMLLLGIYCMLLLLMGFGLGFLSCDWDISKSQVNNFSFVYFFQLL